MKSQETSTFCEILKFLVDSHGERAVRACLREVCEEQADTPTGELALVWDPDVYIDEAGQFYQTSSGGLQKMEMFYNESGRPYAMHGDRQLWAHLEVYRGFIDPKLDTKMYTVRPRDLDNSTCCVSNLMAVRRHYRFRQSNALAPASDI